MVDLGVVFVNAVSGVEVGTEIVWDYLNEYKIPRIIIINKLDKEKFTGLENSLASWSRTS